MKNTFNPRINEFYKIKQKNIKYSLKKYSDESPFQMILNLQNGMLTVQSVHYFFNILNIFFRTKGINKGEES